VSQLYLYDDATARALEPFALTRPAGELRVGALLVRHRWERALHARAAGAIVAPHLAEFEELDAPPAAAGAIPAGAIVANTRCIVPAGWSDREGDAWVCDGRVAAVRLAADLPLAELGDGDVALEAVGAAGTRVVEIPGRWVDRVWQLVTDLVPQLADDIARMAPGIACAMPAGVTVLGAHPVHIEVGALVEPLVVLDATAGPILVRRQATVRAFTRLVGPTVLCEGATVLGGRVANAVIGEVSMVSGEVSDIVVLGHANKSHDGFVGHSYLGRWVNLGAGTITSNLKNTYGAVHLWTPTGEMDTGTVKMGTLFGDHVKTGIGTRLTTGTVVGAGSNVYGALMPPKFVPPFSWGEGKALAEYDVERFVTTARRAMSRRAVALGERAERQLRAAHARGREAFA
jgi:UDP-N-acetylglucosamine diphosphorylase/glucosamine-1-phosphate N-acetyltransferase